MADEQLLYLSSADVRGLGLGMDEVIGAVEGAFRLKGQGACLMPPKATLAEPAGAFAQVMAAWLDAGATGDEGAALGLKLVTVFPQNPRLGLAATNALIVLSEPATGVPQAVMEGGLITGMRTGASVGVAARHLGSVEVDCVGVLGCGAQARWGLRALAVVLPHLNTVRCHDAVPAAAAAFAAEAVEMGLRAEICDAPAGVCRGAGVVVSAISMAPGAPPPLGAGLLEPGALAVALDYDAAWSPEAMAACDLFVTDDRVQTLATRAHGPRLGGIPQHIGADLGEVVAGRAAGRTSPEQRVFCLNLGIAVEDVVCARLVYERARTLGRGTALAR